MKDILKMLIPLVIEVARAAIDKVVKGEALNKTEVQAIQTGYIDAKIWLQDVVDDSVNTIDNQILDLFFEQCRDAALEGGFKLPDFPE